MSHLPNRRIAALGVALVALLALPASAPGATSRVKATGDSPTTFRWSPDFRHITKGNRVKWVNPTSATHRVVAYKGAWKKNTEVPAGESTARTFKKAGAYLYRCTQPGHSTVTNGECSGMCGTIHVTN